MKVAHFTALGGCVEDRFLNAIFALVCRIGSLLAVLCVSQPVFADDFELLVQRFPTETRPGFLRLSTAERSQIEEIFAAIYKKIRLPEDPEQPPKILIGNFTDARAAVCSLYDDLILVNADLLIKPTSEEEIAVDMAHEMTHLDPKQKSRRSSETGRFANEVESEIEGIAKRIARLGQIDPKTQQPQASPYSLEFIITNLESQSGFAPWAVNRAHVASIFKVILGKERYRRAFPEMSSPNPFPIALRVRIGEVLASTPAVTLVHRPEFKVERRTEPPPERRPEPKELFVKKLVQLHDQILSHDRSSAAREELSAKLAEFERALSSYIDDRGEIRKELSALPNRFFREIAAISSQLAADLANHTIGKETNHFAMLEGWVESLAGFVSKPGSEYDRLPYERFSWHGGAKEIFFSLKMEQASKDILALSRSHPLLALEPLLLLRRSIGHRQAKDPLAKEIDQRILEIGNELPLEALLSHLKAKNIAPDAIVDLNFLDGFSRFRGEHLLSAPIRTRLVTDLRDPDFDALRTTLSYKDADLTRFEIQTLTREHRFTQTFASWDSAKRKLPASEMDDLYSSALDAQARLAKEANFSGVSRNGKGALDLYRQKVHSPAKTYRGQMAARRTSLLLIEKCTYRNECDSLDLMGPWQSHIEYNRYGGPPESDASIPDDFQGDAYQAYLKKIGGSLDWLNDLNKGSFNLRENPWSNLPRTRKALGKLISASPILYLQWLNKIEDMEKPWRSSRKRDLLESRRTPMAILPWDEVIPHLNTSQFLAFLSVPINFERGESAPLVSALYSKLSDLLKADILDPEELYAAFDRLSTVFPGFVPETERAISILEEKIAAAKSPDLALQYLKCISPQIFDDQNRYIDFVMRSVGIMLTKLKPTLAMATDDPTIPSFLSELQSSLSDADPLLKQHILDRLSEKMRAVPENRRLFQVDLKRHEESAGQALQYIHLLLEEYQNLRTDQKWELLQWLRGRQSNLQFEIKAFLQQSLEKHQIYLSPESLGHYLRLRFDSLSPLLRATFFHLCLDGQKGLLHEASYRKLIEEEPFQGLPINLHETVRQLYEAARAALPPVLQDLLISFIFAESGRQGSPEVALRLLFSRMGPLVKKLGQNLAFDPHLPESFRKELQKMWDENESIEWWEAYDLLKRQYGDIRAAGWSLYSIRNAGSTEIFVELVGPDGKHYGTSLQRDGLLVSIDTDTKDFRRFIAHLIKNWGSENYGFLELLLEDSIETIQLEANRDYKRQMTPLMSEAYERAVLKLGGKKTADGTLIWKGYRIATVDYSQHPLPGERQLIVQSIAPGSPFKELETSDPAAYREISKLLIQLENTVQNDPLSPIDKDRMPGQYFFDPRTKTITMMDHGQAKTLGSGLIEARDQWIGAALIENTPQLSKMMEPWGISLDAIQKANLSRILAKTSPGLRPIQALHFAYSLRGETSVPREEFFDFVHSVRAKMRLAHWGELIQATEVSDEWKVLALEASPKLGAAMGACGKALITLRNLSGAVRRLFPSH